MRRHSVQLTHDSVYPFVSCTHRIGSQGMNVAVNMRIVSLICCIALGTLNALSLSTPSSPFHPYLAGASVAFALALLVMIFVNRGQRPEAEPPIAEAAKPMLVPIAGNQAEAEIV